MIFSFLFIYIFVVNIVYYVVHIVCQVDVIANSLVLYLPFCSTLNKNFFSLLLSQRMSHTVTRLTYHTASEDVTHSDQIDVSHSVRGCHTQ